MKVGIHANMADQSTANVADALSPLLATLSDKLGGEYGGVMEHLWIDLELIEEHARPDGSPRYPFRFQKRVSGRSHLGLPPSPDMFNVGHFSVRPDFDRIRSPAIAQAVTYAMSELYRGTGILLDKSRRLQAFDAQLFRARFLEECRGLGYSCEG